MKRLRLVCLLFQILLSSSAFAADVEPGGTANDALLALTNPDEYAWKLFLFINQQAKNGSAGLPDPGKPDLKSYDPDRDVVWETWALATGGLPRFLSPGESNRSEVFLDKGRKPVEWENLPRGGPSEKILDSNLTAALPTEVEVLSGRAGGVTPLVDPAVVFPREFEVRMNHSSFQTIRDDGLYSIEGLEKKFKNAQQSGNTAIIQFQPMSKEVKAKWVKITESDKPRYHWRTIRTQKPNGKTIDEVWGLVGLHIITKDLPNWFWCDFEHVDWENKQPDGSPDPRKSVDTTTRDYPSNGGAKSGHDGIRNETVGSKWANYRLRGSQIGFYDRLGNPVEVSNTLIEPLIDGPSSCMSCHARASIGLRADAGALTLPPLAGNSLDPAFMNGRPDPQLFENQGSLQFIQTDFLWSMAFRAHSERE
jgi:hypothetical protein